MCDITKDSDQLILRVGENTSADKVFIATIYGVHVLTSLFTFDLSNKRTNVAMENIILVDPKVHLSLACGSSEKDFVSTRVR